MDKRFLLLLTVMVCSVVRAQRQDDGPKPMHPVAGLHYNIEMQASGAKGQTPLWLNANRYGLSSLERANGYLRTAFVRPLQTDSGRKWALGYGIDVALPYHYTSKVVVQQAFVELRWLHGTLSVGSKQVPMALKNNALSSGSQALGINARPVPQVRLSLPDYWTLPFGNGWLHLKGHLSYGKMTDDAWQQEFTDRKQRYAADVLFHSKAGYLKLGNSEVFCPWSLELGLEMASTFGGTAYLPKSDGSLQVVKGGTGLRDYWKALVPGGSEVIEKGTVYQNAAGNQLGSWLVRVNYESEIWRLGAYADKFFEDHSAMLQLDYDGYGTGDDWNKRTKRRYLLYDFKDWMLGVELNFKYNRWLRNIVLEYIYTKYQSGPVYHDHTPAISDHIGGRDNYYNHHIYTGWQHWGQVMGNPLFRSPIYNRNGKIDVANNRFVAYHLGFDGWPTDKLAYRVLATYQTGYGTYVDPYTKPHHNISVLLELDWKLRHDWRVKGGCAMDAGSILGHNYGVQLTVSKCGIFNFK